MPEINNSIKTLIVKGHAEFLSPSEIIDGVKETFDVDVSNQQVYAYSPNSPKCAEKWKRLHGELREKFLKKISDIPIANLSFQLQILQNTLDRLTANPKNINEAAVLNTIVTAAKLTGGIYATRH